MNWKRRALVVAALVVSATTMMYAALGVQSQMKLLFPQVGRVSKDDAALGKNTTATMSTTSSVHYVACCGLGHRLARQANAYHWAKRHLLPMRSTYMTSDWQYCDHVGVFPLLFGPEQILIHKENTNGFVSGGSMRTSSHDNSTTTSMTFHNEVPGYRLIRRRPSSSVATTASMDRSRTKDTVPPDCDTCDASKIESDVEFYTTLANRYRWRQKVETWYDAHFANFTMVGIHVRAGNGELGHFQETNRGIGSNQDNDTTTVVDFVRQVARLVQERLVALRQQQHSKDHDNNILPPPKLFLATDTTRVVDLFRTELDGVMQVIDYPQDRPTMGVRFGQQDTLLQSGTDCVRGWNAALRDMLLLSRSDLLVAARRSSFVQTLPQSLVLARSMMEQQGDRRSVMIQAPFCQVTESSWQLECYETYMDWCCRNNSEGKVTQEVVHQPVMK